MKRFTLKSAVHLFFIRGSQILLLRRYNTGYQDGNYSVVAGHLDGGEKVIDAAAREALEEVGITLQGNDIRVVGVMHRLSDDERIDFFVTIERWQGQVKNMEPEKCDALRWCPLEELPTNTIPYVRQAIENYKNGVWFDSFGW